MILSSKGKREKSPYSQEVEMLSNSSRVVKEHDNIPMDEDVDESFDPPLHSTAVYTDTEEALEKIKPCSPSSKSETVESSGTTQENTVFKNTIKAPKNKKILAKKVSSFGKHTHPESVNENKAGNTSHTSIQAKKRKRNNRENLAQKKAKFWLQDDVSNINEHSPGRTDTGMCSNRSQISVLAKKHKRKSNTGTSSLKSALQAQTDVYSEKGPSCENMNEKIIVKKTQTSGQGKKGRKKNKSDTIVSSGQGQSSESLDEEEIDKRSQASGLAKKHRRRKKAGTIVSSGQGRSSESLDEEEIDKRSQASGLAKKHKRKKKAGTGLLSEISQHRVNKSHEGSSASVLGSKKEAPRSSRHLTELDIVLADFEKIVAEYRDAMDSSSSKKAVDLFFTDIKEQLTDSIEDLQKLKTLKQKNAKLQFDIGRKRKHLIEVREEVIRNEPTLKQLQKKSTELEEQQSNLKNGRTFLNNLKDLKNSYAEYKAKHPDTKVSYGMSSLPALLLQSETTFRAESHIQNINSKLQQIVDQEKSES